MDKEILQIAYYVAKWNTAGLELPDLEFLELIGTKINISDFKKLMEDFDNIMLDGLDNGVRYPKIVIDVHNDLKNKTMTQVRNIVKSNLNNLENE